MPRRRPLCKAAPLLSRHSPRCEGQFAWAAARDEKRAGRARHSEAEMRPPAQPGDVKVGPSRKRFIEKGVARLPNVLHFCKVIRP